MTEEADSGWAPQETGTSGADPTKMPESNGRVLNYIWIALSFVVRYTVRYAVCCSWCRLHVYTSWETVDNPCVYIAWDDGRIEVVGVNGVS